MRIRARSEKHADCCPAHGEQKAKGESARPRQFPQAFVTDGFRAGGGVAFSVALRSTGCVTKRTSKRGRERRLRSAAHRAECHLRSGPAPQQRYDENDSRNVERRNRAADVTAERHGIPTFAARDIDAVSTAQAGYCDANTPQKPATAVALRWS